MSIEKWKVMTIKEATKEHDKYWNKYGHLHDAEKKNKIPGWKKDRTYCCLCDKEHLRVISGEIYVDDEQYNYEIQICAECIEELYNLVK